MYTLIIYMRIINIHDISIYMHVAIIAKSCQCTEIGDHHINTSASRAIETLYYNALANCRSS
jgi:hypothetical protein